MVGHMMNQPVAAEVRAILARERITSASVAQAAGLTQSQFSRRLHERIPFTADEVAAIAKHLGVTVGSLYGEHPAGRAA